MHGKRGGTGRRLVLAAAVGVILIACSSTTSELTAAEMPSVPEPSAASVAATDAEAEVTQRPEAATAITPTTTPPPTATPWPTAAPQPTATARPTATPEPTTPPIVSLRPNTTSAISFADGPDGDVVGWLFASSQIRSTTEPSRHVADQTWREIETLDGRTGWLPEANIVAWQTGDAERHLDATLRAVLGDRYVRPLTPAFEADWAADTFGQYVEAVNGGDFATAYATRSAALNASMSLQSFTESMRTSLLSPVVRGQITDVSYGQHTGIDITVAFASTQGADLGPSGQTCSVWVLDYELFSSFHPIPVISGARTLLDSPYSCQSLSIPELDLDAFACRTSSTCFET